MNVIKLSALIFMVALAPGFSTECLAAEIVLHEDFKKGDAVKDKGQTVPNRTPGCKLNIQNINFTLYSDRSIHGVPVATVTPGDYETVDYRPGWYKVKAKGWIGWMHDPRTGPKKAALRKVNCPDKNNKPVINPVM